MIICSSGILSSQNEKADPCEQLLRRVDDITGVVTLYSNDFDNSDQYEFIKTIPKHRKATYMLHLVAKGLTSPVGGKGATIYFTDSTQFKKPSISIEFKLNDNLKYEYSVYIPLRLAELNLFTKKSIKKFRLYIYDQDVESYRTDLVACLKTAK